MNIEDDYINDLFLNTCFGEVIDNSVNEKRKLISKTLGDLIQGYWSGHTVYHIVLDGGFIYDGKRSTPKKLTLLGRSFLKEPMILTSSDIESE